MELDLRLRFFFTTFASGSGEVVLELSRESSSESLVVESLWFDLVGLGVHSFFDFLGLSSCIVGIFLAPAPSTWSVVL